MDVEDVCKCIDPPATTDCGKEHVVPQKLLKEENC
jgi:hypothetical protein